MGQAWMLAHQADVAVAADAAAAAAGFLCVRARVCPQLWLSASFRHATGSALSKWRDGLVLGWYDPEVQMLALTKRRDLHSRTVTTNKQAAAGQPISEYHASAFDGALPAYGSCGANASGDSLPVLLIGLMSAEFPGVDFHNPQDGCTLTHLICGRDETANPIFIHILFQLLRRKPDLTIKAKINYKDKGQRQTCMRRQQRLD